MNQRIVIASIISVMMLSCNKDKKTDSSGTTTETTTVDREEVRTQIQALEDSYQESLNSKNTDGIKNFYADDARTYMYGKPVGLGKEAIIEGIQKDFATATPGTKISFSIKELLISNDGDQVVEVGGFKIADKNGNDVVTGHYFGFFEKREGKYVCVREMITPDTAAKQS